MSCTRRSFILQKNVKRPENASCHSQGSDSVAAFVYERILSLTEEQEGLSCCSEGNTTVTGSDCVSVF